MKILSCFLHQCTVYVICSLFVIFVFENNLLEKKRTENRILCPFMASSVL